MTNLEIIESAETIFCEVHLADVFTAECVECEMSSCSDCLRAFGCDNC
jgi:hypothetical protein